MTYSMAGFFADNTLTKMSKKLWFPSKETLALSQHVVWCVCYNCYSLGLEYPHLTVATAMPHIL